MSTQEEIKRRVEELEKKSAEILKTRIALVDEANQILRDAVAAGIDTDDAVPYGFRRKIGAGKNDGEYWLPSDICW